MIVEIPASLLAIICERGILVVVAVYMQMLYLGTDTTGVGLTTRGRLALTGVTEKAVFLTSITAVGA